MSESSGKSSMSMNRNILNSLVACLAVFCTSVLAERKQPLLDLVDVQGIRDNQLVGYGLVVGLPGTGDKPQSRFAIQSLNNMLQQFGVNVANKAQVRAKNIAAVAVQAVLPPMASAGQSIDVTVMSLGDAKSLHGGTLLLTQLKGVDGRVYALAQGSLVVGGVKVESEEGDSLTLNVPTTGMIPSGAILERGVDQFPHVNSAITLNLKKPNYKTVNNMVKAINAELGEGAAQGKNWAKIEVQASSEPAQRLAVMAILESVTVEVGALRPRVVVNSRTGTVVMNETVRVRKAAVSHGNLIITVDANASVSQPQAFGQGDTAVVTNSALSINQTQGNAMVWKEGVSLEVIVDAINSLGATPRDLMSILQALDKAGSLEADLVVI